MQEQSSIRTTATCMTPRLACLFSAASGHQAISTGKERDAESGNDYFGARYYASSMGRFLSPDWSAKAEPVPYAKLDNPQSLNLYAYVLNNPLTHLDPDGHGCEKASGASAVCKAILDAMSRGADAVDAMRANARKFVNQAGSYFYAKGFKGSGNQLTVTLLAVKLEVGHEKGTEVTSHLNGDHEVKEIKSKWHVRAEIFEASAGFEQTVTADNSHPELQFTYGWKGKEGSGGQIGGGVHPCFGESCSGWEGGIEAGKAVQDFSKWLHDLPDPGPFSYKNK